MREIQQLKVIDCTVPGYIGSACINYNQNTPVIINEEMCNFISNYLQKKGNLVIRSYQSNVTITNFITWKSENKLTFITSESIILESTAFFKISGVLELKSGIESSNGRGTVILRSKEVQIETQNSGKVKIYYNPIAGKEDHSIKCLWFDGAHKYLNPNQLEVFGDKVKSKDLELYKLINNIEDLKDIKYDLSNKYALSQDIVLSSGINFSPLASHSLLDNKPTFFKGILDGNGYKIKGLKIIHPEHINAGLFVKCLRSASISNIIIEDFEVEGKIRAGTLCGIVKGEVTISNVTIRNSKVTIDGNKAGASIGSAIGGVDRYSLPKVEDLVAENISLNTNKADVTLSGMNDFIDEL